MTSLFTDCVIMFDELRGVIPDDAYSNTTLFETLKK